MVASIPEEDVRVIQDAVSRDHVTFVDVCGYSPAVLMAKAGDPGSSKIDVYNDRHAHVVDFFAMLRDKMYTYYTRQMDIIYRWYAYIRRQVVD